MADEEAMWDELEQRLVRQIMKHVTDRLDFILDHSIPARISTILHQTAVILAEDIKQDLDKTLEVLVTHAVLDELLNIRSKKLAQQDETN
jgi:hypothetical protein